MKAKTFEFHHLGEAVCFRKEKESRREGERGRQTNRHLELKWEVSVERINLNIATEQRRVLFL